MRRWTCPNQRGVWPGPLHNEARRIAVSSLSMGESPWPSRRWDAVREASHVTSRRVSCYQTHLDEADSLFGVWRKPLIGRRRRKRMRCHVTDRNEGGAKNDQPEAPDQAEILEEIPKMGAALCSRPWRRNRRRPRTDDREWPSRCNKTPAAPPPRGRRCRQRSRASTRSRRASPRRATQGLLKRSGIRLSQGPPPS